MKAEPTKDEIENAIKETKRQDTSSSESEIIAEVLKEEYGSEVVDISVIRVAKKIAEKARAEGKRKCHSHEFVDGVDGKYCAYCEILESETDLFIAGRQSALAEIDEGAKLGVERCKQNFLTMLDTAFKNGETKQRAEKQEQVRKLKDEIKNAYRDDIDCALIPRSDVQDMINKIFPDCADSECQEGKFCAKHGVTHIKSEVIK